MTSSEKKKLLRLIEAANAMSNREPGAVAAWRKIVKTVGLDVMGVKKGTPQWANPGGIYLGALTTEEEKNLREEADKRAKMAVEIAQLEGRRTEVGIENRALELMDLSVAGLRKMRRELRAKGRTLPKKSSKKRDKKTTRRRPSAKKTTSPRATA